MCVCMHFTTLLYISCLLSDSLCYVVHVWWVYLVSLINMVSLPGAPRGKIRLLTEEVADSKITIGLNISATKLDKKDFFGKVRSFALIKFVLS